MVPLGVLRHTEMVQIQGQWSCCFKLLMRNLFVTHNLTNAGVLFNDIDDGQPGLVFFKFDSLLADLDAHKMAWCMKGAAATIPCWLCGNVSAMGEHGLAPQRG